MAKDTKKVGGASTTKAKEKKSSSKRVEFKLNGKVVKGLTNVPKDFDFEKHLPLKKAAFEHLAGFTRFQAASFDHKAIKFADKAELLRHRAERFEKLGDDKTAKKVKRAERIKKQLADLTSELEAAGIDLSAISIE